MLRFEPKPCLNFLTEFWVNEHLIQGGIFKNTELSNQVYLAFKTTKHANLHNHVVSGKYFNNGFSLSWKLTSFSLEKFVSTPSLSSANEISISMDILHITSYFIKWIWNVINWKLNEFTFICHNLTFFLKAVITLIY